MMIPSLVRITSECCHAPDAVNVNIASSESVPVFSWLIRWQPSRCPPTLDILDILDIQPHLLSPVYPAHTSSPAPCTEHTDTCWTRSPATALKHQLLYPRRKSTAAMQYQASDVAKLVGAEECKSWDYTTHSASLLSSISAVLEQGPVISASGHPTPPHIASIIARGPPGPGAGDTDSSVVLLQLLKTTSYAYYAPWMGGRPGRRKISL